MMGLTFEVSIIIIPGTTIWLNISSVLSGTLKTYIKHIKHYQLVFSSTQTKSILMKGGNKSSSSWCSKNVTSMWNSAQNRLQLSNFSFHPFKSFFRGISRIWASALFPTSCWASCWCSEQQWSPSAGWPLRLTLWRLKLARGPWQRRAERASLSVRAGFTALSHRVQTVWITFPLIGLSFYFALWGPFSFCSSLSPNLPHTPL